MDDFMQAAIAEAQAGLAEGGIPIGSVLVHRGEIIGRGHNRRVQQGSSIFGDGQQGIRFSVSDQVDNQGWLPNGACRSVAFADMAAHEENSKVRLLVEVMRTARFQMAAARYSLRQQPVPYLLPKVAIR